MGQRSCPFFDHVHGLDSSEKLQSAAERYESQHWICDSLDGPVDLLDDVVEVLALAHLDIKAGVNVDVVDRGCVGTAFVNGDLLWQTMQVDGTVQLPLCCRLVSLGSDQEVNRIACLVHSTMQVSPLTIDFDIDFVRTPSRTHRTLASAKDKCQDR